MDEELEDCENFIHNKFGYCFYTLGTCCVIYNLYVHPQYRRYGHSRTLLKYVIGEIRGAGYEGLIHIEVNPRENSIASTDLKSYYKNMGLFILDENDKSLRKSVRRT